MNRPLPAGVTHSSRYFITYRGCNITKTFVHGTPAYMVWRDAVNMTTPFDNLPDAKAYVDKLGPA